MTITQIVERYGEWTAHNIHLVDDIYTIGKGVRGDEILLRRIVQMISDISNQPLSDLRILDIGCLEGLYAIELARHGASVVAIEARGQHIEKAWFAKEVLSLDNLELVLDDVRNLSEKNYGHFNVVLCLGILYHLDVPDIFHFVKNMAQVCKRYLIIDTHVSLHDEECCIYDDKRYWGIWYQEHRPNSIHEERLRKPWASLNNIKSFWFTRPSLYNLLSHAGFTSIYECHNPPVLQQQYDRITLLAIKGRPEKVISSPLVTGSPIEDWPEKQNSEIHPTNIRGKISFHHKFIKLSERFKTLLPGPIKRGIKKLVHLGHTKYGGH